MTVNGFEVSQAIIDACLKRMEACRFRLSNLVFIITHKIPIHDCNEHPGLCHKIADRIIQREVRAGRITGVGQVYPYWIVKP